MPNPLRPASFFLPIVVVSAFSLPSHAQTSFSTDAIRPESDERQLEAALAVRGSINFVEIPLRNAVATLSQKFQIPILLAAKKLEEASVSPDTPITKRLHNLPLESLLKIMLAELELGFTIRDNVLLITTPEDLESNLSTHVYPVLDLVMPRGPGAQHLDYDSLIDLITLTIAPTTWDDVGGPGSIEAFDNAPSLVVSQTRAVHIQLENLLITLRRVKTHHAVAPVSNSFTSRTLASRPFPSASRSYSAPSQYSWQLPQLHAAAH